METFDPAETQTVCEQCGILYFGKSHFPCPNCKFEPEAVSEFAIKWDPHSPLKVVLQVLSLWIRIIFKICCYPYAFFKGLDFVTLASFGFFLGILSDWIGYSLQLGSYAVGYRILTLSHWLESSRHFLDFYAFEKWIDHALWIQQFKSFLSLTLHPFFFCLSSIPLILGLVCALWITYPKRPFPSFGSEILPLLGFSFIPRIFLFLLGPFVFFWSAFILMIGIKMRFQFSIARVAATLLLAFCLGPFAVMGVTLLSAVTLAVMFKVF